MPQARFFEKLQNIERNRFLKKLMFENNAFYNRQISYILKQKKVFQRIFYSFITGFLIKIQNF